MVARSDNEGIDADNSQAQRFNRHRRVVSFPFRPDRAALLVIDMQRYFTDPASHAYFEEAGAVVRSVQKVISSFRRAGRPVIFTKHALNEGEDPGIMGRWWGDLPRAGDPISSIDGRVMPLASEPVIRKTRYSAFIGTDLDPLLKILGVSQLVIVGVMTHLCCESTARDAFMRDYEVFFVTDATATDERELHEGTLRALADGFAILVTAEEVERWTR